MIIHIHAHHVLANRLNAIKLRNFIGIQTIRLWIIRLKYQTLPNLKVWTPKRYDMALANRLHGDYPGHDVSNAQHPL
jgi:hypothetical protein